MVIRRLASSVAQLMYPVKPMPGMLSGRTIDIEHWRKVETIFPVQGWQKEHTRFLVEANEARLVEVQDGRKVFATLDSHGFELFESPTSVQDFNAKGYEQVYRDETARLLSSVLPSVACVVPFHSLIRDSRRDNLDSAKGPKSFSSKAHAPVSRVHGDYTADNAPLRFKELKNKGLISPTATSYAIVNTWRSISPHPVRSKPLAVLDASTVHEESVFAYALVHADKVGYNNSIAFDPNHKWTYFPDMTREEILIFFTFDGRSEPPRYVFHTAIDLPSSESNGNPHPRHSIEVRSLVAFEE